MGKGILNKCKQQESRSHNTNNIYNTIKFKVNILNRTIKFIL